MEEQESLRALAMSPNPIDRRRCYEYLFWSHDFGKNGELVLEVADSLIKPPSSTVRWGTLVLLGEYCASHPKRLWPLVIKWGSNKSDDIRMGVACCILEHVLEYHFAEYFAKAKDVISGGNKWFARTLAACYKFGQAEEPANAEALDAFRASVR